MTVRPSLAGRRARWSVLLGVVLANACRASGPAASGSTVTVGTGEVGGASTARPLAAPVGAPTGHITVVASDASVPVGADTLPVVEPHLAIHPGNPAHLLAGVTVVDRPDLIDADDPPGISRSHCVSLVSTDHGQHWATHTFPVPGCADPWVAVQPDGTALFAMISTRGSRLLVFRSRDGGHHWEPTPADFGRGHDHAVVALDTTRGPGRGSAYVVSRQDVGRGDGLTRSYLYVARSGDAGRTWDTTRVLPFSLAMNTMSSVVLSDGALVVPLSTFGPPLGDIDWFVTSTDRARTFSEPVVARRGCAKSFPHLAADGSGGPFRDRLYYVCNDSAYARVLVFASSDRALRWTPPVAVNADARMAGRAAAPSDTSVPYVRTAVAAVDARGILGVSWYDARRDPDLSKGRSRCQEVVFSASLDGGRTFLPDVPVSTDRNCPATPRNGAAGVRWRAGGDYHGLVAGPDGRFHLLWADSRSGVYQLRFASVRVESAGAAP